MRTLSLHALSLHACCEVLVLPKGIDRVRPFRRPLKTLYNGPFDQGPQEPGRRPRRGLMSIGPSGEAGAAGYLTP